MTREQHIHHLDMIAVECSKPNWDGYDALAVTTEVIAEANRFLEMVPDSWLVGSFHPSPHGMISFECDVEPGFSIDIDMGRKEHATLLVLNGNVFHGVMKESDWKDREKGKQK